MSKSKDAWPLRDVGDLDELERDTQDKLVDWRRRQGTSRATALQRLEQLEQRVQIAAEVGVQDTLGWIDRVPDVPLPDPQAAALWGLANHEAYWAELRARVEGLPDPDPDVLAEGARLRELISQCQDERTRRELDTAEARVRALEANLKGEPR